MKTSLRMSRPQSSAHFSPPFWLGLARFFSPLFFFPVRAFYNFCYNVCGQSITFWYLCYFHTRPQLAEVSAEAPTGRKFYAKTTFPQMQHTLTDTYSSHIQILQLQVPLLPSHHRGKQLHMCTIPHYLHPHTHARTHLFLKIPPQSRGFYLEHASNIVYTGIVWLRPVVTVAVCACLYECA